ncbi:MAG: UvrD-helicase domain-containing protein [Paludibacteraceae bacterium]|nr:UvrD-helicase domain-containing protein [Paludibacteraceae bacterium]
MSEKSCTFAVTNENDYRTVVGNPLIDIQHPVTICRASAGTGKTYTLSAYYVGLLLSGEDYRSILAITFTNKATAEMSERIIGYLHAIAQGEEKDFLALARQFMIRDAQAPDALLQQRAARCFKHMLLDYDNVQIMTIDSFLQTLLSGLAGVLKMSAGMNTELDIDHVISQAVDQLLTTDMTAADRTILEDYMRLKLDQESRWDVRQSLCTMAKELYNESVQVLDAKGLVLFAPEALARRREIVQALWEKDERVQALAKWLKQCNPEPYNRNTRYGYDRLVRSLQAPDKMSADDRFRGVSEKSCNADEMLRASEMAAEVGRFYNTLQLTVRFSRDIELMGSLQALIQRNLTEANCALLARTAATLTSALRAGDADFILEKAGIRYRHVLMDEFQDTSQLQWSVIRQLLQDVLAGEGNTLLIVGDIKQSIYRWRNGDWHIMESLTGEGTDSLTHDRINERFTSLTRNFRSSEEVVRFNLSLFKHIYSHADEALIARIYEEGFAPEQLDKFYQSNKKKGGYVRFKAFPKGTKEELTADMFDRMEQLMQKGTVSSDIMILVRDKKDAAYITDLHAMLDAEQYPHLSVARMVSADSFLLEASEAVRTVIAGLRYVVKRDEVAAAYIAMTTGDESMPERLAHAVTADTPLYEAVCELIKLLLTDEHGQYKGTETAYINNLLDRTRAYVSAYGAGLDDFLTYWDDTMHAKPIPALATDAIRIMTVHASKGLQAQTLFVPFCIWPMETGRHAPKVWCQVPEEIEGEDYVPVQYSQEMLQSAYDTSYEEERMNLRIDNLNLLYVALTRAEDNLYISTMYPVKKDGTMGACNHVGRYIMNFAEGDDYEAGVPVVAKESKRETKGELIRAELWANSDQVRFVQSQEGALYTDYGEEAYRRVAKMDEGNLCHEIFAHLRKADELELVLDAFESRGEIRDKAQRESLKALISSAWEGNEQMRDWFTAPWQLKLEEPIYMDHRELRPDRVMINPQTNEAIVLDYKFGQWEDKYTKQVGDYMEALRRMGYSPVRGYLWFAHKQPGKQLVQIHG